jgi:hypothetical protein
MLSFENHFTTKDTNDTKDLYCGVGLFRRLGYKGSALQCNCIEGDGRGDTNGLTENDMASRAVRVNLYGG